MSSAWQCSFPSVCHVNHAVVLHTSEYTEGDVFVLVLKMNSKSETHEWRSEVIQWNEDHFHGTL